MERSCFNEYEGFSFAAKLIARVFSSPFDHSMEPQSMVYFILGISRMDLWSQHTCTVS